MDLDLLGGLRGSRGSAFDVPQRVAFLVGLEQLVDVRTLAGPGDAAQEQRPIVDAGEVLVEMPGGRNEAAIRRPSAFDRALVGPDLRLDVGDAHPLSAA